MNAAIAFALNISLILVVQYSSSLALTLSGMLKDIMLVASSVIFFGTPIATLQILGYGVALSGILYFKKIRTAPPPKPTEKEATHLTIKSDDREDDEHLQDNTLPVNGEHTKAK